VRDLTGQKMAHFLIAYLLKISFIFRFILVIFCAFISLHLSCFISERATQMQIFADEAVHLALPILVIESTHHPKVRCPTARIFIYL